MKQEELVLDSETFPELMVRENLDIFKDVAESTIENKKGKLHITFNNTENTDQETLHKEFLNYCIVTLGRWLK